MGLSIHYSGYIRDRNLLSPLIEEVTDICKSLGWASHIFNDEDIQGVSFAPKKSEPVFLTFDQEARTLSPTSIIVGDIYEAYQLPKELRFTTSTKTQFAGIEAHKAIIKFLKHLDKKYLKDFTLIDEGSYWETGDENILQKQFDNYNAVMDIVSEALNEMTAVPVESTESLADRLERLLNDKLDNNLEE